MDRRHPPDLLAPRYAAERLAVSERTLADWRYRGVGPPYIAVSARCVRYRAADIEEWVTERAVAPVAT